MVAWHSVQALQVAGITQSSREGPPPAQLLILVFHFQINRIVRNWTSELNRIFHYKGKVFPHPSLPELNWTIAIDSDSRDQTDTNEAAGSCCLREHTTLLVTAEYLSPVLASIRVCFLVCIMLYLHTSYFELAKYQQHIPIQAGMYSIHACMIKFKHEFDQSYKHAWS